MREAELLDTQTIQSRARELAARLGAPSFKLQFEPMHDGSRHLEVSDAYYFVATERGVELERRRTTNVDELLYWVMERLTGSLSWDYELTHRRQGEDSSLQAFAKQTELLAMLSPEWAERQRRKHAGILSRYPFRDA